MNINTEQKSETNDVVFELPNAANNDFQNNFIVL